LVFGDFLVKKWVMDLKDEALIMGLKFVKNIRFQFLPGGGV
jgi:hypothetical protein